MMDGERDIIILVFLLGAAIILWRWRFIRFFLLGAAALLDASYIIVIMAFSLVPGHNETVYIFPRMFWIYISLPAGAAVIFALFARGKKIWHYFWLACAIFMGLPFFLLLNWLT